MSPFSAFIAIVCALFVVPEIAHGSVDACPRNGQFKGVELYSWKSAGSDDWVFALLPGTNREKTEREIKHRSGCILSADELALAFERLDRGDEVFWIEIDSANIKLPERDLIERVADMAKSRGLILHVPPANSNSSGYRALFNAPPCDPVRGLCVLR